MKTIKNNKGENFTIIKVPFKSVIDFTYSPEGSIFYYEDNNPVELDIKGFIPVSTEVPWQDFLDPVGGFYEDFSKKEEDRSYFEIDNHWEAARVLLNYLDISVPINKKPIKECLLLLKQV